MADGRREFDRRGDRIEELVRRLETESDPALRAVAQELVRAVIELHGAAMERIVVAVSGSAEGEAILAELAADELVAGVLSLHGVNPVDVEARVAEALDKTRPYIESHGGKVDLASIEDGVVHVRLRGACGSCSTSGETLKNTVESAVYAAAPEVVAVVSDAAPPAPSQPAHSDFVILQSN
jgi:Fe-S cluster biogenesis protein NfuA